MQYANSTFSLNRGNGQVKELERTVQATQTDLSASECAGKTSIKTASFKVFHVSLFSSA